MARSSVDESMDNLRTLASDYFRDIPAPMGEVRVRGGECNADVQSALHYVQAVTSARSARQHKAWGASPRIANPK